MAGPRRLFTDSDDEHLVEFLAEENPALRGRQGHNIYKKLTNENSKWFEWGKRRTWQSWRERYRSRQDNFNTEIEKYQRARGISSEKEKKRRNRKLAGNGLDTTPPHTGAHDLFTYEDDQHLLKYVAQHSTSVQSRRVNQLYQNLVQNVDGEWPFAKRHTWESWKDRYSSRKAWFDQRIEVYQRKKGWPLENPTLGKGERNGVENGNVSPKVLKRPNRVETDSEEDQLMEMAVETGDRGEGPSRILPRVSTPRKRKRLSETPSTNGNGTRTHPHDDDDDSDTDDDVPIRYPPSTAKGRKTTKVLKRPKRVESGDEDYQPTGDEQEDVVEETEDRGEGPSRTPLRVSTPRKRQRLSETTSMNGSGTHPLTPHDDDSETDDDAPIRYSPSMARRRKSTKAMKRPKRVESGDEDYQPTADEQQEAVKKGDREEGPSRVSIPRKRKRVSEYASINAKKVDRNHLQADDDMKDEEPSRISPSMPGIVQREEEEEDIPKPFPIPTSPSSSASTIPNDRQKTPLQREEEKDHLPISIVKPCPPVEVLPDTGTQYIDAEESIIPVEVLPDTGTHDVDAEESIVQSHTPLEMLPDTATQCLDVEDSILQSYPVEKGWSKRVESDFDENQLRGDEQQVTETRDRGESPSRTLVPIPTPQKMIESDEEDQSKGVQPREDEQEVMETGDRGESPSRILVPVYTPRNRKKVLETGTMNRTKVNLTHPPDDDNSDTEEEVPSRIPPSMARILRRAAAPTVQGQADVPALQAQTTAIFSQQDLICRESMSEVKPAAASL